VGRIDPEHQAQKADAPQERSRAVARMSPAHQYKCTATT
jgi:hypothetical protein